MTDLDKHVNQPGRAKLVKQVLVGLIRVWGEMHVENIHLLARVQPDPDSAGTQPGFGPSIVAFNNFKTGHDRRRAMAQVFPSQQFRQLPGVAADLLQAHDVRSRRLNDLGSLRQWLSAPRATMEDIIAHDPQAGLHRLRLVRIRTRHARSANETNHRKSKN